MENGTRWKSLEMSFNSGLACIGIIYCVSSLHIFPKVPFYVD